MNRLGRLKRLASVGEAMLRGAERDRALLAGALARLDAEAAAMRAILDREAASFVPVEIVARRIAALDRQKGVIEASMRQAANRVLEEARRLKLFERALDDERSRQKKASEAAELGRLIEQIAASGPFFKDR